MMRSPAEKGESFDKDFGGAWKGGEDLESGGTGRENLGGDVPT